MITQAEQRKWINGLGAFDMWNTRHILAVFALFGLPQRMLDVGCGTGVMPNIARKLGVEAYGVDQLIHDSDYLFHQDLGDPFSLSAYGVRSGCDMVISVETAEHIANEKHEVFCDSIAEHVASGGLLIFTAAQPGQQGDGHIGCQPAPYWRQKFHDRGLNWHQDYTTFLTLIWSNIGSPTFWLASNCQVFKREV